jgi:hypothetical protein
MANVTTNVGANRAAEEKGIGFTCKQQWERHAEQTVPRARRISVFLC